MGLSAGDIATLLASVEVVVTLADFMPAGVTATDFVTTVGGKLRNEAQDALYKRYGTLPTDLPQSVLDKMADGIIAEGIMAGFFNQEEDEKEWPDEWRRRWDNALAAWASGVDQIAELVSVTVAASGSRSNDRIFTAAGFDALL